MDRRLVITSSYLVLALLVLTVAGLYGPAGAPASAGVARLPQPAPGQLTERRAGGLGRRRRQLGGHGAAGAGRHERRVRPRGCSPAPAPPRRR